MALVQLHGVGVAWATAAPLFDSVSLRLDDGFYGLVGANGAGKTTLLSILAGTLTPHAGKVTRLPKDAAIAYCRQTVDACDGDVHALAARDDGLAAELRGRLALSPDMPGRWPTLSPGERKRWQIAAALAREPDVLLLDEPTNHLDADGRGRLLGALRCFAGLAVVVSHDRGLLDVLTTATIRIHQGTVRCWPGHYSAARGQWERERAHAEAVHQSARARVRVVEAQVADARRIQAAATRGISRSARMKDKHDSDARGIMATTKAQWAQSRAGRQVATARTDLAAAQEAVTSIERDPTVGGRIFAAYARAPMPVLFRVKSPELRRGDHVVLRDAQMAIGRDDRVRIEGPNGAGKTTLLEALLRSAAHPERVLYLPQEVPAHDLDRAVAGMRAADADSRGRWFSIFAALGSDPTRVLRADASHLSPGEARKLVLAGALARQVWALVLDEPTNHLDLPSIERLEEALSTYPGCIVLVTHDDAFARRIVTRSIRLGSPVRGYF
jgi:ATPase subunit of ABC transporter with duplicated ATPase domains